LIKLGLMGKMASGKTQLAEYFLSTYGGQRVAFADALKGDIIQYGLTPDGTILKARDRGLLQSYGQLRRGEIKEIQLPGRYLNNKEGHCFLEGREIGKSYSGYWVDQAMQKADTISNYANVIMDDIRRINEAEALRNHGFLIVKLYASDVTRRHRLLIRDGHFSEASLYDVSESEIDSIAHDVEINNDFNTDFSKRELDQIVTLLLSLT